MVIEHEKKTESIDPDTLTGQKSNKIFQGLMKSISDATEGNKFIGEYMTQVYLFVVLCNSHLCSHTISSFRSMAVVCKCCI